MQTGHNKIFLEWAVNVINYIKTKYFQLGIVPTHFLREIFSFPTYQIYQIISEIDKSAYRYIKSTEINDYNIIAAYHINTNNNLLIRSDVYTIERIIKTESKLDKIDRQIDKYNSETLYICKIKNENKAFILKRIFWSNVINNYSEFLTDSLDILKNTIDSFKNVMFSEIIKLCHNRYLLTTYSDRNILTKITLKARFSKYNNEEIEYKYVLFKEYENAKILRYKPIIYKIFRKESEITDKNLLPNEKHKETLLIKEQYLANIRDIYQTVLMHELLTAMKLL